ncbi:MAG: FAD-binding protein [Betaproteobacteria bacterium]|nr:FAD-binding protein [Betaproteobacteria bacterium]
MDRAPKHISTVTLHPRAGDGALAARLRREIRGEVLFDAASRGRYSTDASIYQIEPVGVVVPRTEEDARIAIQIAVDQGVPILPRGGGTSQCGQTVGAALVIDNSKYLNQLVAFDKDARTAVVQPGMVLDQLNAYLKPHGLWFPVDVSTSAQATLGGMAGNNSCGSRSIRYGNMVHNVLGIDALLADGAEFHFGASDRIASASRAYQALIARVHAVVRREAAEIEARWPKMLRRVQGYNIDMVQPGAEASILPHNLAHLLVGSEGTLAYSRRIHLALAPLPQHKTLGVCHFPTFHQSMLAPQHIVKLGPTAVELVDRTMIELARGNAAFRPIVNRFLKGDPDAILLVEFSGDDSGEQLAKLRQLVELMAELGFPGGVVKTTDATLQKEVWEVRKAGLNIMMSMKGEGKPVSFIEDCAVPLEHLAEYTDKLTQVFARHGTRGTWYAHASVGTLHVRPVLNMKEGGARQMRAIAEEACELVKSYKGAAYSGEHGDGLARSEWIEPIIGARLMRALEEIKDLFDPRGLMNPGKIVRGTKQDDRSLFRFKPGYAAQQLDTALDWSEWNAPAAGEAAAVSARAAASRGFQTNAAASRGFVAAVEMCNNNGHCRKFDAGSMCPSYRATGNERDLTRGRANTLRLALSGQLGADAFTSDAMYEAMDLCVSCKGCKRECPTGVDMAKMKIEFLYHYHKRHGVSLKDSLITYLPRYAPWATRLPWLANLRDAIPGLAALSESLLGLSAKRSLPKWRGDAFHLDPIATPRSAEAAREVVLLVDTFNNYFEPDNARAALAVLEAAGYRVHLARGADGGRPLCCGRTFLATGLVDEAKAEARRTIAALQPYVERGLPIVGLEPSCLYTLRDEFKSMLPGATTDALAARALLFEEFLAAEHEAGRLKLKLKPLPQKKALLHGHCHQKAFGAMSQVAQVLGLVPELKVETVEASCCGMAGAFGYEAGHYEVSMKMAEASLLPALRKAGADTLLVADGTSCRHQIHDSLSTGKASSPSVAQGVAVHVAQVLARALG